MEKLYYTAKEVAEMLDVYQTMKGVKLKQESRQVE